MLIQNTSPFGDHCASVYNRMRPRSSRRVAATSAEALWQVF